MTDELEAEFERLARDVIGEAEVVKCDFVDFAAGLRIIESTIRYRREDADTEQANREE